jgi:hypothetical protein
LPGRERAPAWRLADVRGPAHTRSHDPADAARFTVREWVELSRASPKCRPLRPDGKPNRPITALTVRVVPVDPGELPSILPDRPGRTPMTDAEFMARFAKAARTHAPAPVSLADEPRAMGLM